MQRKIFLGNLDLDLVFLLINFHLIYKLARVCLPAKFVLCNFANFPVVVLTRNLYL